jgi:hypothetical protein
MSDKELTEEEKKHLMIESGYELAESWITNAVQTAENDDMMSSHLFVLHVASVTMLAQEILNFHIQNGIPIEKAVEQIIEELVGEVHQRIGTGRKTMHAVGAEPVVVEGEDSLEQAKVLSKIH